MRSDLNDQEVELQLQGRGETSQYSCLEHNNITKSWNIHAALIAKCKVSSARAGCLCKGLTKAVWDSQLASRSPQFDADWNAQGWLTQ